MKVKPNTTDLFPPGEYIRDELEARNWTQEDLAEILGRPLRTVNQIIAGKKGITPKTAQELAAAFGTSAELWLNLENAYRLGLERKEQSDVSRRARLYQLAPIKDMIKRGWISGSREVDQVESSVCSFFGISSVNEKPILGLAARKGTPYGCDTPAQVAWCFRAKRLAERQAVADFDIDSAAKTLPKLRELAATETGVREVPAFLAGIGICFVIVEHLPKSKIDGATFWLDDQSPAIVMSLRYDRIDYFWHTLLHELSHVMHRDGSVVDSDLEGARRDESERPQKELRADREASNFLIPSDKLDSFIARHRPRFAKVKIIQFANLHKIHPGIVVGQLQYRKAIAYSQNREMLAPVRENLVQAALTDGWGYIPDQ